MTEDTFDVILLIGRPACGKSRLIASLASVSPDERRCRFHIARLDAVDDFPMVWAWLEEDHILCERLGQPRLHTDADDYFKYAYLWHVLLERLSLAYERRLRDDPTYHDHTTLFVEFARGSEHGGYAEALPHLGDTLLGRAAIVYVRVSWKESLRRNRCRFKPERPDGVLEHSVPEENLTRLYRDDDWGAISQPHPDFLTVQGFRLPYVVFDNEQAVETGDPGQFAIRLEPALGRLWELHRARLKR
jgi:hypothetical protein